MSELVVARFQAGGRALWGAVAVGVLGLGVTALGLVWSVKATLYGYLFAFAYWLGLCLGALLWLSCFHASSARWPVVVRRALEVAAATCPLFVLLFIPIAVGAGELFPWVHVPHALPPHEQHLLEHKRAYLNVPFFVLRAAFYFAVWCGVGLLLWRWSRRQDEEGEPKLTLWQRRLAAGSLPLVALCLSFATLDWFMSLEPLWYSTIYALYYFAGSFVAALALLTLVGGVVRGPGSYGSLLSAAHYQKLGTLLLAFCCFWAYMAFSQYMLMWLATLPEEATWYLARSQGGWGWVAIGVALGQFVLPLFLLMSRALKRNPRALAAVALWLLVVHAADVAWLLLPALEPTGFRLPWQAFTALAGVGGLCVAWALWWLRGAYTVPVRDPYLYHSLHAPYP